MGNSERVEGQEYPHTAGGLTGYLCSATTQHKNCLLYRISSNRPCLNMPNNSNKFRKNTKYTQTVMHNSVPSITRLVRRMTCEVLMNIADYLNTKDCTMALGSTQPLTEISTRDISWGVKAART